MAHERALAGQAAFITGGGGGIGSGAATWLARDGAAVVIMGRTEATLVDAKQRIGAAAGDGAVVDDIAAGVRYLLGPESSWVTGQSFGIEGGNELTRAPYLEALVRRRFGDRAI